VPRRPPHETFENFVERQIREGREAGEFDGLEGAGRPLPGLDDPPDELWWIKQKMRREDLSFVPDSIAIRRDLESLLAQLPTLDEADARARLCNLDARIRKLNATVISGPPTTVAPLDVDAILAKHSRGR
jgi:Domain of unknown function (DUF1992)